MAASAAVTSPNSTPKADAVGITLNRDLDRSEKFVLPSFTAVNIRSLASAAPITSAPYAFTTDVIPSTVVVKSVTPPIAALFAVVRKSKTFSFGTPAEIA